MEIANEKYRNDLGLLNQKIMVQQKKIFGGHMTEEIKQLIDQLCPAQDDALYLLNTYLALFGCDLIEDLKKINSSYDTIRTNVSKFIELDIIEEKYPHAPKK